MEREEERERRRIRDRQRRQSMTKEQRERHLARRRRNYQLRRQRAANAKLMCLPQSTFSFPTTLQSHGQETLQLLQESPIHFQGFPRRLRLSSIKRLARTLTTANPKVSSASGLIVHGAITKPLRFNSVKRLARSLSSTQENTAVHNATVTNS